MWSFREWRRRRFLTTASLPDELWRKTLASLPVLSGLCATEKERLRELVLLFLHEKTIIGVQGQEMTDDIRLRIAAQACLPILELGLDSYREFSTVLVYPGGFRVRHEYRDEVGVVHSMVADLSGEAWERGPLVLSAQDVLAEGRNDGVNLVIHEFAHKLDMLTGAANGLPPLHPNMRLEDWTAAFESAYQDLCDRCARGEVLPVDAYVTESPAECFAVLSEAFFEIPEALVDNYPRVFQQLAEFYRQNPLRRLTFPPNLAP